MRQMQSFTIDRQLDIECDEEDYLNEQRNTRLLTSKAQ